LPELKPPYVVFTTEDPADGFEAKLLTDASWETICALETVLTKGGLDAARA
jgi:hypothetical protein